MTNYLNHQPHNLSISYWTGTSTFIQNKMEQEDRKETTIIQVKSIKIQFVSALGHNPKKT